MAGAIDEAKSGIDVPAADDDDVDELALVGSAEGPGGASAGVAWSFVRDQHDAAQLDAIAIVEDAIDMGGRIEVVGIEEVLCAAAFDNGNVGVHDHVFRVGHAQDGGAARVVIPVGVADEQDADVGETEAELLDAFADERGRAFEAGVDEDVAGGCDDEVRGQIAAADVVEVVGDLEGRDGRGPLRALDGMDCGWVGAEDRRAQRMRATNRKQKRMRFSSRKDSR